MKLPERFCLTIEGQIFPVVQRENITRAIGYYLTRLLTGQEVSDEVWAPYRLRVTVETDTDQGDD